MKNRIALVLAPVALAACGAIWMPANRTSQQSTDAVNLSGYTSYTTGSSINFVATDHNTNAPNQLIGQTTSQGPSTNALYPWSAALTANPKYWAPQSVIVNNTSYQLNGLATSIGRLEVSATDKDNAPFYTFSKSAQECVKADVTDAGDSWVDAGAKCSDGKSLVVFDTDGVGVPAAASPTAWNTDYYTLYQPPFGAAVTWEIHDYLSQGTTIYALVCRLPDPKVPDKAMIINHGATTGIDYAAFAFCVWGAQQGFVTAVSAYRGEGIPADLPTPPDGATVPANPAFSSNGHVELCLGEVIDSMQLTKIVQHSWGINPTRTVMWGYSHGACVTERAVESGVQVSAAAAFSAPTDFVDWYDYCPSLTPTDSACHHKFPDNQYLIEDTLGIHNFLPVAPSDSRIPYDWRSPVTYAADLAARKDVSMLLLQGNNDVLVETAQACELANSAWGGSSVNYHFPVHTPGIPYSPSNNPPAAPPVMDAATTQAPGGADHTGNSYGVPTGCDKGDFSSLVWKPSPPAPTTWSQGTNYLLVYDGLDHNNETGGPYGIVYPFGPAFIDFAHWLAVMVP
jgi:hypothetical protein